MKPKVLIYDIESCGVNALFADLGFVVVFGYKWLGEKKTHSLTFDKYRGYIKNGYSDKGILREASKLFAQADLIVGHYSDYFDLKFINGRLLINGLPPIPPTKTVDVVKLLWKNVKFFSNRLKAISNTLKLRHKKSQNKWPDWWFSVMAGDRDALHLMAKYCENDVKATEQEYLKIRPLDKNHVRLFDDRTKCGLCGGKIQYRGFILAKTNRYRRYQCTVCRAWGHENKVYKTTKED